MNVIEFVSYLTGQRGSDDGVVFSNIMPESSYLFCTSSKIKLAPFMMKDWKRPHLKEKLEGNVLYVGIIISGSQ